MGLNDPGGGVRAGGLRNLSSIEFSAIPDSGVSRWTFDDADTESGTAIDVWGNNDGTINGATTGVSGVSTTYDSGEAYSLDGGDDEVTTALPMNFGTDPFSVAIWIDFPSSEQSIQFGTFDGSDGIIMGFQYTADIGYKFWINGNQFLAGGWQSGPQHLVFVRESDGTRRIYRDASELDSLGSTESVDSTQDLIIGQRGDKSKYIDGPVDDPRVYDKALSATEVSNLYNTGSIDG